MVKVLPLSLVLIMFTILSSVPPIYSTLYYSSVEYVDESSPVINEHYGIAYSYVKWLDDEVIGFYSPTHRCITYLNIFSGDIRYFYIDNRVGMVSKYAVIGSSKLFIVNSDGHGFLYDLETSELIWDRDNYLRPLTLLYYQDRIVLANTTFVEIINPYNGQILSTYSFGSVGRGRDYIVRSGYVVFIIYNSTRYDKASFFGIDYIGVTNYNLGYKGVMIDADPYKNLILIKYPNRTIRLWNFREHRVVKEFDYSSIPGVYYAIDSRDHLLILGDGYNIDVYSLEDSAIQEYIVVKLFLQ